MNAYLSRHTHLMMARQAQSMIVVCERQGLACMAQVERYVRHAHIQAAKQAK